MSEVKVKYRRKRENLTAEEKLSRRNQKHKEYVMNLSDERKELMRQKNANKDRGYCAACGRKYVNIYNHFKTKKHEMNEKNEIGSLN